MRILDQHVRDEAIDGRLMRRTIGHWLHYRTPGGLWAMTDSRVDHAPEAPSLWSGVYDFTSGCRTAPLQVHFGSNYGAPMVGVRLSERPDYWMNLRALGAADVEMAWDERGAYWPFAWDGASLRFESGGHKLSKSIVVTDRSAPRRYGFTLRLAPGHTYSVAGNVLRIFDSNGAEWLHTPAAWAEDGDGNLFAATLREGQSEYFRGRYYPTLWVEIGEADLAERPLPIAIDPTATVSGATDVEDTYVLDVTGTAEQNNGAVVSLAAGRANNRTYKPLLRCPTSKIPGGAILDARFVHYRRPHANSTGSVQVRAYVVKAANDWAEGASVGTTAATGEVCWTYCKYTSQNWAGAAGCSTSGTDYDADASPPGVDYAAYTSGSDVLTSFPLKPAWFAAWRDGTHTNNGVVLVGIDAGTTNGKWMLCWSTDNSYSKPYFEIDYARSYLSAILGAR